MMAHSFRLVAVMVVVLRVPTGQSNFTTNYTQERKSAYLDEDDPGYGLALFNSPSLEKIGLADFDNFPKTNKSSKDLQFLDELQTVCPPFGKTNCPPSQNYRTVDGSCNNLLEPWKGAGMTPMQRLLPPFYDDGFQRIRRSMSGKELPSAREVSLAIHTDKDVTVPSVTLMLMQWGQFLAHDLAASSQPRGFNGSVPRCCQRFPTRFLHPSCLPIPLPSSDPVFSKFGATCMEFLRSSAVPNCKLGYRDQMNQASSFLDASTVYGSDRTTLASVREFVNGRLKFVDDELCRNGAITTSCFASGDHRAGEHPGLTSMHLIWVLMHNKLAEGLKRLNPDWVDEKLFQESRKILGGLVQHITYNEYLPLLLGPEVVDSYGLKLEKNGYYDLYNPKVDPTVTNAFATAAFRFGHSIVPNSFIRTDFDHNKINNNTPLHLEQDNLFFGALERLLLGFLNQPIQRRDQYITQELTSRLFQKSGFGLDLAAINIQRGRDHGLQPFVKWRQPCGLAPVRNWDDFKPLVSPNAFENFRSVYSHVEDIDLFSGGLAEKPVRDSLVGPTFGCVIAQQFFNLRQGDRFWYENVGIFTPHQLEQIRNMTLAKILCQTTRITTLQPHAFVFNDSRTTCTDDFDLTPWMELDVRRSFDRKLKKTKKRQTTTRAPPKTTTRRVKTRRTTTESPLKLKISNITTQTVKLDRLPLYQRPFDPTDVTYMIGYVTTPASVVNINVQYFGDVKRPNNVYQSLNDRPTVTRRPTNLHNKHLTTKRRPYFKDKLPESFLYQGTRNYVKISSVKGVFGRSLNVEESTALPKNN